MREPKPRRMSAGATLWALICATALAAGGPSTAGQSPLEYPPTPKVRHVDTYHGTEVEDPYRWIEAMTSAAAVAWVAAQNRLTEAYLGRIPFRRQLHARVREVNAFTRFAGPKFCCSVLVAGPWVFFTKQEAGESQPVVYVQRGLNGAPAVLLNPNEWAGEGTLGLGHFAPSPDGTFVVYGIVRGGSDWQEYRVMDVATRRTLDDRLQWIKGYYTAWHGDGFFYARPDEPKAGEALSAVSAYHTVYFHRLGTPQSADAIVHREAQHPSRHFNVIVSADRRTGVLLRSAPEGGGRYPDVSVRDLSSTSAEWRPVIAAGDAQFDVVDVLGDAMVAQTTLGAPRGRIVRIDLRTPEPSRWVTLVPERDDVMQVTSSAGGRLFVRYLKDVTTRVLVYRLDGSLEHELPLPGLGLAFGFTGGPSDRVVFYTFTSLSMPDTIYAYDIEQRASTVFKEPRVPGYDPGAYEVRQVFYPGKDGTRIPIFLLHRKGLARDGTNPVLLHAYGAFGATSWPWFDASRLALVERGFVYAIANIRGGGEYGRDWHEAGKRRNRQTTFDDFIAAAEWLVAEKYTTPARLAIHGVSSGGTLVGVVINQRPDLFGAAIPEAGVMDMLRFQRFTTGQHWVVETGSSDDPQDFSFLLGYSPLHNVRSGTRYPRVLILTSDRDDRVVPAHSYKYAATLQAHAAPEHPVLLRVETESGHASSSLEKDMSKWADVFAFLLQEPTSAIRQPAQD